MPRHTAFWRRFLWSVAIALTGGFVTGGLLNGQEPPIQFSRDILPLLSENCFACHGPDAAQRKGDLRLDTREGALAAISLESPDESEFLRRITTTDPDEVMPPPNSHRKPIAPEQVAKLRRWIAAGAPWGRHWSLEPPVKLPLPSGATHPIDAFVRAKLAQAGLAPSSSAPPATLLRRLSFDLTGLPPRRQEVVEFNADPSPARYEQLVERWLASPHHAERLAMWWLDAARYSDTDGYQGDETRTNWPWRDWVIDSFHRNMPFDQFTREQFAGDLLPNATPQQRLATCFHRNHMTNGEGGRDPEESRIDYVIDRVNTVGTVWLGLTLGCCQCHSHKYDPITQRDYYSLAAFFNSIDEDGKAGRSAKPYLSVESTYAPRAVAEAEELVNQRRPVVEEAKKAANAPFEEWLRQSATVLGPEYRAWSPLSAAALESTEGTSLEQEADGTVQASGANPNQDDYRLVCVPRLPRITGLKLEVFPHPSHTHGLFSRGASGHFTLTDVKVQIRSRNSSQVRDVLVAGVIADHSDDPKKHNGYGDIKHVLDDDPRNGWSVRDVEKGVVHEAIFDLGEPVILSPDEQLVVELRQRSTLGDANVGRFRLSATDQRGPATQSLGPAPLEQFHAAGRPALDKLDEKLKERLRDQFLADHEPFQLAKRALDRATRQLQEVQSARKVEVMVLAERKEPRASHVLVRGVWDKKGEVVTPDVVPAVLPWQGDGPRTRLELAGWLVSRENPLTARVVVNHVWQMFFGAGIVRTTEDFGVQGERPSHPELLDWLAVELMEHHWDLRHLIRLIVTSETYRQSSALTPELLARDPENRLLARGSRFRLPSWMLRDSALFAADLLNPAIGGPPVRPYQPDGVWEEMFMGRFKYEPSEGAAQFRRSVYAFWRRAISPTFLFDSAQRRVCEVRLARTNTPLQALTLLNDRNYLVASRGLAELAWKAAGERDGRLTELSLRILSRPLSPSELAVLTREVDHAERYYAEHPMEAANFLTAMVGTSRSTTAGAAAIPDRELAPLALAASLLLNLDEAMTHE